MFGSLVGWTVGWIVGEEEAGEGEDDAVLLLVIGSRLDFE